MSAKTAKSPVKQVKKQTGEDTTNKSKTTKALKSEEQIEEFSEDDTDDSEHGETRDNEDDLNDSPANKMKSRKSRKTKKHSDKIDGPDAENRFPVRRRSYHNLKDAGVENISERGSVKQITSTIHTTTQEKILESAYGTKLVSNLPAVRTSLFNSVQVSKRNITWLILMCALSFAAVIAAARLSSRISQDNTISIESIRLEFPRQENQLWRAVLSGLNDTLRDDHPSSYIFLHESGADQTMKKLLNHLSKYAVCRLSDCQYSPIKLNRELLKSPEFSGNTDFGSVIVRFKDDLEKVGLMVIENLDQIPQEFAMAFHSLCDEISPLVKKSAFFFTMKVDKFSTTPIYDLRNVESTLREKWKNIEDEKFGPLFTRISAMPLRVYPEK